jgi:hypothetical protein
MNFGESASQTNFDCPMPLKENIRTPIENGTGITYSLQKAFQKIHNLIKQGGIMCSQALCKKQTNKRRNSQK